MSPAPTPTPAPRPMRGVTLRAGQLRLIRSPGNRTFANPAKPLTLRQPISNATPTPLPP